MNAPPTVLLTRFNLPTGGVEGLIRAREGWLRERVDLFERYTVPSVQAQTAGAVHWIVYLDPQSPAWLMERMEGWRQQSLLVPVQRSAPSLGDLAVDLWKVTGTGHGPVITANLDNDDALAVDFVERLQGAPAKGPRNAIYLTRGLVRSGDKLFLRTDKLNAFCAVREPLDDPVTCWADWHNRLPLSMPVVHRGGSPAWLQVVHGANVSNRARGRLTNAQAYKALFPGLLDDVKEPSRHARATDVLIRVPGRQIRDGLRSGSRRLVVQVLGKDGFDRMKYLAARGASAEGSRELARRQPSARAVVPQPGRSRGSDNQRDASEQSET